jgi:hypothetical protein
MTRRIDAAGLAGIALGVLALALSWGGVRVARADREATPASVQAPVSTAPVVAAEGPTCRASEPPPTAEVLEQVRQRLAAESARDVVQLNGRGYNYGPAPRADLEAIFLEARRQGPLRGPRSEP